MDIAKVTSKGQVTVPKSVREKLELEAGSKIVFIQVGDDLVVRNASSISKSSDEEASRERVGFYRLTPEALPAFRRLQEAFAGLAEEEGITTDEELVNWMKSETTDKSE